MAIYNCSDFTVGFLHEFPHISKVRYGFEFITLIGFCLMFHNLEVPFAAFRFSLREDFLYSSLGLTKSAEIGKKDSCQVKGFLAYDSIASGTQLFFGVQSRSLHFQHS